MNQSTRKMLNSSERQLLRETEPAKLRKRDEDELVELHRRVRRARTKYAKLYRRRASAQVNKHGTRAMASKANKRTSVKAEVFEDALARVSRRLAKKAAAEADQLRDEPPKAAVAVAGARRRAATRAGRAARSRTGRRSSCAPPSASAPPPRTAPPPVASRPSATAADRQARKHTIGRGGDPLRTPTLYVDSCTSFRSGLAGDERHAGEAGGLAIRSGRA